jgi:pimeloyl-ACP methyl ester carboxylesterase
VDGALLDVEGRAVIAPCDGAALHVAVRGAGVPLLLVHGFPHDHTLWRPQLDALGDAARVIAPDLRGFGRSGGASSDGGAAMTAGAPAGAAMTAGAPVGASVDRYADDLACVLDAAGVRRAVVGGLSMGGYVALAFWRRHRERVRALVLADTRAGADDDEARAKRREMIALARERGSEAVAARMLDGMVGKTTRARAPELVDTVRQMLARQPVPGIVDALQAMHDRPDSTPDLATIDVPTLVVVGDEDVLTPVAEARRLHEGIAGSRLEVLAGAGHVSNVERAAAFTHVVRELLRSLPDEG